MGTPLKTLVDEVVRTLQEANYQESTINEYRKTFYNLMHMADSLQTDCYSYELGENFRNDTISERTGKYSLYRWKRRNRCVQMFNWFEEHGSFRLDAFAESRIETPSSEVYNRLMKEYIDSLANEGLKANTIDSFRNVSCKFLQFLELKQYQTIDAAPADVVYDFIADIRKTWAEESLRTALSGLRSFLAFTGNEEHYLIAVNVRTVKARKIIPVLTQKEENSIWDILRNNTEITRRDKAITLIGLLAGVRACDIINLKLSNIDWRTDSISIIQQKTGKPLDLPLIPVIGNAVAEYIMEERPQTDFPNVFISQVAPYRPFAGHSAIYLAIKRVFNQAGIDMGAGVCGTRLLRHNTASRMLANGIPIETIASTLGHVDPDSTDIYLTTDERHIRECALPLSTVPMGLEVLK